MIVITKSDVARFNWGDYEKLGTTKISDEVVPAGTKVQTLGGEYICAEASRLAVDAAGNVYPIAESIFRKCYRVPAGGR